MPDEREGGRRGLGALGERDFRLFYAALVVASVGAQVQATANIWQVYELTASPLHLGLIGLARGVPIIALSLVGGVVADRVDRRRLLVSTQALMGLLGMALGLLTLSGTVSVWHIYLVTMLTATLSALNNPAQNAILPTLVPPQHLLNAFALNSTVFRIAMIVGPTLAGTSIAVLGAGATYLGNGSIYLVTLALLLLLRLGPVPPRPRQSPLQSLAEGLAFVRRRSVILALLTMDCAQTFFGAYRVLMPVFAVSLGLGAEGLGVLLAAPALGGLLAAGAILGLGDVRYKGVMTACGILGYCAALTLLANAPWFPLAVLAAGLLGVCDSVQMTPRNTVIQAITPDALRGRVSSFQTMLTNGMPSLGQTQLGATAALVGGPLALSVGAVACALIVVAVMVARPDLRAADLGAEPAMAVAEG